jgi:multidrug efflux pump subunit AcrA (membrane-fusion protein)
MGRLPALICCLVGGCVAAPPVEPAPEGTGVVATQAAVVDPEPPDRYLAAVVPRRSIDVASGVAGELVELPVQLGERVAANAVVARLRNADLEHSVRVARAMADAADARATMQRRTREFATGQAKQVESLRDHVSQDERARALHEARLADASARTGVRELEVERRQTARLRAQNDGLTLRAPFDAEIAAIHRDPGQRVQADEPVLRLVSTELVARFAVPLERLECCSIGTTVMLAQVGGGVSTARVTAIAPEVDAAGLVLIEAAVSTTSSSGEAPRAGGSAYVTTTP